MRRLVLAMAGLLAMSPAVAGQSPAASVVPAGARLDIRLQTAVDSSTTKVDQKFEAATIAEYTRDGRVMIPVISPVNGFVSSVNAATPSNRNGRVTLSFDSVKVVEQSLRLRATVDTVFTGENPGADGSRLGADAVVGSAIGRVPGPGLSLLTGVTVDIGGAIVATGGTDVHLPVGTILRIRLDRDVQISGTR